MPKKRPFAQKRSPLGADSMTAAQQKTIKKHGLSLSRSCKIVRTPGLEVWCPARGGGVDRVLLSADQKRALRHAEDDWEDRDV